MNINIEPRSTMLRVVLSGPFSLHDAKNTFVEIAASIGENNSEKVLIDGRHVTGDPTLVERFYYGEFAANTVRERLRHLHGLDPQFAYVLHEPVLDPHRFGETVALNRGMHIKVFDNLDEAVEWLGLREDS